MYPRKIRIDPSVAGTGNDGLDRRLDLAMINTGTVQRNKRYTAAVLNVMDHDFLDPAFHIDTVIGTDDPGRDKRKPDGDRLPEW